MNQEKKGAARNPSDVGELRTIFHFDIIKNLEHLGKLIKEGLHLMYQKGTAKSVLDSLLKNL